jgi:hypothetical protein
MYYVRSRNKMLIKKKKKKKRLVAQGVRVLSLKISNFFNINHHNKNMSAVDKHLAFTQCMLEKIEATLSVGLLEKEAAFAVAERMVASLVCYHFSLLSLLLTWWFWSFSRIITWLGSQVGWQ